MKSVPVTLLFAVVYFTVLCEGLFRSRRHDMEIKYRKGETVHANVGIPLVFGKDKQAHMRTGIPELRTPEDVDTTGDSTLRDMSEDDEDIDPTIIDEDEDSESGVSEKEDQENDDDEGDDDDDDEKESQQDKEKKNPEELGEGYEKIDLGFDDKDDVDDDDSESKESKGKDSNDGDIMDESPGAAVDSKGKLDLHGDFPPNADQVNKLPKDEELTPEQAARKRAEKRKGYVQFTIKQKYRPELKYKESAAYKILAGNVVEDVERALKATGVVRDVLFREAKDVGGPPYRSKVQVFLKLQNVGTKKLKRIVDYGLINGMITIPGSFYA